MNRTFKEVTLPISGIKAEIYDYYLRGERKQIEAIMFKSAEFENDESGTPKLKNVDASYRTKMEDEAVILAIKKLVDKQGNEIKASIEVFDGLPNEDFELLQKSLPSEKLKKK